jgi:hypothetical protein
MFGILKSSTNTGLDSELLTAFVAPIDIVTNRPESVSDTLSLKRLSQDRKAQRWEITTNVTPSNNTSAHFVHLVTKGSSKPFYVRMPQLYSQDLMPSGYNLVVTLEAQKGTDLVAIGGISKALIKAGEFITFSDETKVYLIVDTSDPTYTKVYPEFRSTKAIGVTIKYGNKVTMSAKYDTDVVKGARYADGILTDPGTVKLIEAV